MSELARPKHSWPLDYGDPLAEYRALCDGWGRAAFPGDGAVVVEGDGGAAFLDAALSTPADVPVHAGGRTLALGEEGGVRFDLCLSRLAADRFLLTGSGKVGAALIEHLGALSGAAEVTLSLAGERWLRVGLGGPRVAEPLAALTGLAQLPAEVGHARPLENDGWLLRSDRSGQLLYEWFVPHERAGAAEARLDALGAVQVGCTAFGWAQLENGRFFQRQIAGRLPGEIGLTELVDPAKAAFLGRAAVRAAEVTQRLTLLAAPGTAPDGSPLLADGGAVGELLHSAQTPRLAGEWLLIAVVAAAHTQTDGALRLGEHVARVIAP